MSVESAVRSARACLVVTTIGDGAFLEGLVVNMRNSVNERDATVIIIPDRKTPASLFERCQQLVDEYGVDIRCPALEEQVRFLRKLGMDPALIPYDSDNRRNVGFLMALESGCEFMISIDDDNYCRQGEDFFTEHAVVCQPETELRAVHSASGWYNICKLMDVEPSNVYPRGFPYRYRHRPAKVTYKVEQGMVHLNAGLWLQEPDLDAVTWLANPARAHRFRGESILLGETTWSPTNTQNTALHRDAIVAYYFVRMGYPIAGLRIDRYGDIFSGCFCQACVRHLGYRIRVGTPTVDHRRNAHDYLRDLTFELACIWLIEDIAEWLREVQLEGNTYAETYLCLADAIDEQVERFEGFIWTDATRGYFHHMTYCMRQWVAACRQIG